uniref:uncharacterized protein LOC122601537 n=1 Tax=Erigeron canadensis TaxID=72917 RepID=UPI001CB89DBC|nr:uncharacterized protein LOC122601537 [Erigeron canadensis]
MAVTTETLETPEPHVTPNTTLTDPTIDSINHPLYLHQNDHPGLILIAKKLTGSENYNSWKRSMTIALNAKNKLKIVNGDYTEPALTSELRPLWERTNDMVISWILNTVSDQISNNVNFISSAFALWRELGEHYSQLDGHRIFQVNHELNQLCQADSTLETYYHKIKGLWDEIDALETPYACSCKCTCENGKNHGAREQRKRLIQFLMGLDESYSNIRGQILLIQPLPTFSKAYTMLRQEEKQREGPKLMTVTPIALNTMSKPYVPRSDLHVVRKSAFKKGTICTYCHKEGHTKDECYKIVDYPFGHPLHMKYTPPPSRNGPVSSTYKQKTVNMVTSTIDALSTSHDTPYTTPAPPSSPTPTTQELFMTAKIDQLQNQLNQVMLYMQQVQQNGDPTNANLVTLGVPLPTAGIYSFTFNSMPKFRFIAFIISKFKDIWITDSGATDHISNTLENMHNTYLLKIPIILSLPNGQTTLVTIVGSVTINEDITLHDVFYVPSFTYNLISISKLLTPHTSITFTYNSCIFQDHNKQIAQGILCNGLYLLSSKATSQQIQSKVSPPQQKATILNVFTNAQLWHARLGHCSFPVLKQIKSLGSMCTSRKCNSDSLCSICPLSKHHMLPFHSSTSHALSLFDLVHIDV